MTAANIGVRRYGIWLMALASVLALALSIYNYLDRGTGIDHTGGALLVIISSALILLASILLATVPTVPGWLRSTFTVLLFLGVLGTAAAAYFLETQILIGLMAIALIGWLWQAFTSRSHTRPIQTEVRNTGGMQ